MVDGGYLLHSVVWPNKGTYGRIIENYVEVIVKRYGKNVHVVFDGYPEYPTTKGIEHIRRGRKTSHELKFIPSMECSISQNEFLANPKNKSRLIGMLAQMLNEACILTVVAEEDADKEVVERAVELCKTRSDSTVVVIG